MPQQSSSFATILWDHLCRLTRLLLWMWGKKTTHRSVCVFFPRNHNSRICVDFRKFKKTSLQKNTISDSDPIPQLNDMFQNLTEEKYFIEIDLSKGYWQIPMAIVRTYQKLHCFLHRILCVCVALKAEDWTHMKGMRRMLRGIENVHNYIDSIFVHIKT